MPSLGVEHVGKERVRDLVGLGKCSQFNVAKHFAHDVEGKCEEGMKAVSENVLSTCFEHAFEHRQSL